MDYDHRTIDYDEARVATLKPIEEAIAALLLPPLRGRKLNTILDAIEMQIEDWGDHQEVNRLLLEALRVGAIHQVGEHKARHVLEAIDVFAAGEATRWEQVRVGTLPRATAELQDGLDGLLHQVAAINKERLSRNEPCWCGSGRKYKSCHLRADRGG